MQQVRTYASLEIQEEKDEALAEIRQAFTDHSSRIASEEDVKPVEALLEELADVNSISPVAAAAGFALASALPAAKQGAPAWRLASSWSATMRAVEFIQHSQKITELTGSADDDGDTVFGQCLVSLRTWKQELGSGASGCTSSSTAPGPRPFLQDVLGNDKEHLSSAVGEVEKWVKKRARAEAERKQAGSADSGYREAGGHCRGQERGSRWKGKLEASSSWDDVRHEAGYHLVIKVDETITRQLHEVMDEIFLELKAARSDLENMYQDMDEAQVSDSGLPETVLPVNLSRRMTQAQKKAEITHTESFFYEIITGNQGSSKAIMIQKRMESMAARAIESDTLQPAIWRKAQLLSAARRRPNDPAPPAVIKQPVSSGRR